jgi:hypothetical protein
MNDEFGAILEPAPVAFSFDAPGWDYLVLLIASALLLIIIRGVYFYHKNAYRREAIKQIARLSSLGQINFILKSLALRSFGREEVASLYGEDWMKFLLSKLKKHSFSQSDLTESTFQIWQSNESSIEETERFKNFSTYWIKNYHV